MLIQIQIPDTCRDCFNCEYDESSNKYLCKCLSKLHFVIGDTHLDDCIIDPDSNKSITCLNAVHKLTIQNLTDIFNLSHSF